MITRHIGPSIQLAMADTPVVLLNGARQTGKTTLARAIAEQTGAAYFTLLWVVWRNGLNRTRTSPNAGTFTA